MAAYTSGVQWKAALYPDLSFGEPLCCSHVECPDITEDAVEYIADCDKWSSYHRWRVVANQSHEKSDSKSLDKSRQNCFIFQPLISNDEADHNHMMAKTKEADNWARLQPKLDKRQQIACFHALMCLPLDHLWSVCYKREEAKPYVKARSVKGKRKPAKDAIHYSPETFEKMIAEYMGIKEIKFGDVIVNKENNDPNQTMLMQGMDMDHYAQLRAGEIDIMVCKLFPIQAGEFLGLVLAHETVPVDTHQYLGCTTVIVKPHLPPIVVITTHNVCPLHESHTAVENVRFGAVFTQSLLKYDAENPGELTKWDQQALMMMIGLRNEADKKALMIKSKGLIPASDGEDVPEAKDFVELSKQPTAW